MAAPMISAHVVRRCRTCSRFYRCIHRRAHSTHGSSEWRGVIGLEIHAQILSTSKLFSGAATQYGAPVNTQVSLFDASVPGTLPVLNRRCVEAGVLTSLALNCHVNKVSKFDRKHYFYADLPAGYQITQQRQPLAVNGKLNYAVFNSAVHKDVQTKTARIIQVQLEQDSGKSIHDAEDSISLIDLNRAGVALMEIVTAPDFSDAEEAAGFIKELLLILRHLGTCDCKMSEGSLRVDANVSVHKPTQPLGVRTEVKNINSIRNVVKAIEFEIKRQIKILKSGGEIVNETRSIDPETGETVSMRDKEKQQDYRFLPEPNLPPLRLYDNETIPPVDSSQCINVDELRNSLPILPEGRRNELVSNYGLTLVNSHILVANDGLEDYFRATLKGTQRNPVSVCKLLQNEFMANINRLDITIKESPINPDRFGGLFDLISEQQVSMTTAKKVLILMFDGDKRSAADIMAQNDWFQILDADFIETQCRNILNNNEMAVKEYKKGKVKILNGLIGQVQKRLKERGEPRTVMRIMKELLSK